MKVSEYQFCAYDPTTHTVIDYIEPKTGNLTNGQTLEQCREQYPNADVWAFDLAVKHYQDYLKSEPEEISEQVFIDRLNFEPPIQWVLNETTESFKMCELLAGTITGIYARIGNRFFYLTDEITLTHDQIIAKIRTHYDV